MAHDQMTALGIDIGGTGIKAALVDVARGVLVTERIRVDTPAPATPRAVVEAAAKLVSELDWAPPCGVALPAVVRAGMVETAANIDPSWIGVDATRLFAEEGLVGAVLNDADAAGLGEMRFGAGRGSGGVVIVVTLGTGIGTALFSSGVLVPNTELGHLTLRGDDAEHYAGAKVRKDEGLGWQEWAVRVQEYLQLVERLLWPDLIIVGGGVSRRHEKWLPFIDLRTEVVPAQLANTAGIVGAACAARPADAGAVDLSVDEV